MLLHKKKSVCQHSTQKEFLLISGTVACLSLSLPTKSNLSFSHICINEMTSQPWQSDFLTLTKMPLKENVIPKIIANGRSEARQKTSPQNMHFTSQSYFVHKLILPPLIQYKGLPVGTGVEGSHKAESQRRGKSDYCLIHLKTNA